MKNIKKFISNPNELSFISIIFVLSAIVYTVYIINSTASLSPQRSRAGSDICTANFTVYDIPTKTPTKTPTPTLPLITLTKTPTHTPPVIKTPTPTVPVGGCINYGVDEHSNDNCSNIITIDLQSQNPVKLLKPYFCATDGVCDAEGMDNKSYVYMVANKKSKSIYKVNKSTGGLPKVIDLKNSPRMEGLSFRKNDPSNIVWGGSPNQQGIYKIDLTTGQVVLKGGQNIWIKTISWNNAGTKLFVSNRTKLFRFTYDPNSDSFSQDNFNVTLPGPTDAMDMTADGYIVGGYKSGGELIFYFLNPVDGKQVGGLNKMSLNSLNNQIKTATKSCGDSLTNLDGFTWLCGNKPK